MLVLRREGVRRTEGTMDSCLAAFADLGLTLRLHRVFVLLPSLPSTTQLGLCLWILRNSGEYADHATNELTALHQP